MTCKDCIHNDICKKKYNHMYESYYILDAVNIESVCKSFKDKSNVETVVHGHWKQKGFDCICSNCGGLNGAFAVKYCPDCGAKMDGKYEMEADEE